MAYSRCGLTKISFVRHENDVFIKYSIPIAVLVAVRIFAEEVNTEFTVMPSSLICSAFCIDLPTASSSRTIRRSGGPHVDR